MCEKIVLLSKRLISWAPDSRQAHVGFHQHKLGTRICTCCAHCARSGRFVALGVRHNSWVSFPCVFVQWSFMMLMHLLPTLSKSACLTASYCIAVKHWESKGYALKMHAPPGMEFHSISPIFWGNAVEHADIPLLLLEVSILLVLLVAPTHNPFCTNCGGHIDISPQAVGAAEELTADFLWLMMV